MKEHELLDEKALSSMSGDELYTLLIQHTQIRSVWDDIGGHERLEARRKQLMGMYVDNVLPIVNSWPERGNVWTKESLMKMTVEDLHILCTACKEVVIINMPLEF